MIWYALHCRSQRELSTAEDLRKDGRDVFVATQNVIRMARNGRGALTKREKIMVAAPGYVFCDEPWGHVTTPWGSRQRHRDIIGTLTVEGVPYAIPDAQMTSLKVLSMRPAVDETDFKPLTPGQVVRLTGTAYDNIEVAVSRMVGKRVEVVMQLLGGERKTVVERAAIAA